MCTLIRTALLALAFIAFMPDGALAGTVSGAVEADNDFIVVLHQNGTNTIVYQSADGGVWEPSQSFTFSIQTDQNKIKNCTINIIAWGDGSPDSFVNPLFHTQGVSGILKGNIGSAYTGSGNFTSWESNISSGSFIDNSYVNASEFYAQHPAPTAGQIAALVSHTPKTPAVNIDGTVTLGSGTGVWGVRTFPPALMGGVTPANFHWIWPTNNFESANYSIFSVGCGKLVRATYPKLDSDPVRIDPPKDGGGPPPIGGPVNPIGVDTGGLVDPAIPGGEHYQCYLLAKGNAVKPETIYITDQFGSTQAILSKPVLLCNPSSKRHNGKGYRIQNEKRHLVCYDYASTTNKATPHKLRIKTQFGEDIVVSGKRRLFCAPALKEHIRTKSDNKKAENIAPRSTMAVYGPGDAHKNVPTDCIYESDDPCVCEGVVCEAQNPGGPIATPDDCTRNGGRTVRNERKTYCALPRQRRTMSGSGAAGNNGDFTLETGGGSTADKKGKHRHKHKKSKKQGHRGPPGNTEPEGDFTLETGHPDCTEGPAGCVPNTTESGGIAVSPRHDPKKFGAGGRGTITIDVDHMGGETRLAVMDRLPPGLSVTPGTFNTGAWTCSAGVASAAGQDVTCTHGGPTVGKTTLALTVDIAAKDKFPKSIKYVQNCVTVMHRNVASHETGQDDGGGIKMHPGNNTSKINGNVKVDRSRQLQGAPVCDDIRIKGLKSNKIHFGIGIGVGGSGGGRRKGTTSPKGTTKPGRDGP